MLEQEWLNSSIQSAGTDLERAGVEARQDKICRRVNLHTKQSSPNYLLRTLLESCALLK
jgi:hypothetical protein